MNTCNKLSIVKTFLATNTPFPYAWYNVSRSDGHSSAYKRKPRGKNIKHDEFYKLILSYTQSEQPVC